MSEFYSDNYVASCPYCGGTEMIEAVQSGYAAVTSVDHLAGGDTLYHTICRNCGSVLRSYVSEPEMLLKRSERREVSEGEGWKKKARTNGLTALAAVLWVLFFCAAIPVLCIGIGDMNGVMIFIGVDLLIATVACLIWFIKLARNQMK